jgi:hypothetical protein
MGASHWASGGSGEGISWWCLACGFTFYNQGRPHTALDGQTPDMVYFARLPQREAA